MVSAGQYPAVANAEAHDDRQTGERLQHVEFGFYAEAFGGPQRGNELPPGASHHREAAAARPRRAKPA